MRVFRATRTRRTRGGGQEGASASQQGILGRRTRGPVGDGGAGARSAVTADARRGPVAAPATALAPAGPARATVAVRRPGRGGGTRTCRPSAPSLGVSGPGVTALAALTTVTGDG